MIDKASEISRRIGSSLISPQRGTSLKQGSQHIARLQSPDPELELRFCHLYGDDPGLLEARKRAYRSLLEAFLSVYGDRPVTVVRSPARINLLGMHVDHRGGHVNHLCIAREILIAAEPRKDDVVAMHNTDPQFEPRTFRIGKELPPNRRGDWFRTIEQASIRPGDWQNYVRAPILRLQDMLRDRTLRGMNLMVTGDIPQGMGLSSSSALVIAAMEAILRINDLTLSPQEKITFCGEGEWYVGTRGGWGDHAAMVYGKRDRIAHIGFFPLSVEMVSFFPEYKVVACNSFVQARKAIGAKHTYNARVAAYEIGLMWIKKLMPECAERLVHFRDVNIRNLDWSLEQIYGLLKALPERITRGEALEAFPDHREALDRLFRTHDEPEEGYPIRQVCLYGLAECERSRLCVDFLKRGDAAGFGRLKYIAHSGDRVCTFGDDGKRPWNNRVTDEDLDRLIASLRSADPQTRVSAQLHLQPGGYGCSCEELDQLVDIAKGVDGVAGAGLTGAGLGGCVLVLVREECVQDLIDAMNRQYYIPRGFPSGAEVCTSVEGAGVVMGTDPGGAQHDSI